jgi:hypothetical protein
MASHVGGKLRQDLGARPRSPTTTASESGSTPTASLLLELDVSYIGFAELSHPEHFICEHAVRLYSASRVTPQPFCLTITEEAVLLTRASSSPSSARSSLDWSGTGEAAPRPASPLRSKTLPISSLRHVQTCAAYPKKVFFARATEDSDRIFVHVVEMPSASDVRLAPCSSCCCCCCCCCRPYHPALVAHPLSPLRSLCLRQACRVVLYVHKLMEDHHWRPSQEAEQRQERFTALLQGTHLAPFAAPVPFP